MRYLYTDNENYLPQDGDFIIPKSALKKSFGEMGKISDLQFTNKPKTTNTFAHVFWSKPTLDIKPDEMQRWSFCNQYELMLPLCALSLACLKKLNQKVILITDQKGKELLQDLDYDEIIVILDDYEIKKEFWAFGKIAALQYLSKDIVLIDTDLFIYDSAIIDRINSLNIVCSHLENTSSYQDILPIGEKYFSWLKDLKFFGISSNTGIIKCTDLVCRNLFIDSYYKSIKIFEDKKLFIKYPDNKMLQESPDLLVEQFNYYNICKPTPIVVPNFGPNAQPFGFCHLLGISKYVHMPLILDLLKSDFPEYYNIIIKKWEELDFSIVVE